MRWVYFPSAAQYDIYTLMMLHMDGTAGSTTITDAIGNFSFTAAGNAQIDTAQSKFGGASLLLDGTGDYVYTADSALLAFATGDFTFDWWMKRSATDTSQHNIFGQGNSGLTGGYFFSYLLTGNSRLVFSMNSDTKLAYGPDTFLSNTNWHHCAVERYGNQLGVAVDGTFGTLLDVTGVSFTDCVGSFAIGRLGDYASSTYIAGWIDEFRLSDTARYGLSSFTPPTTPYS